MPGAPKLHRVAGLFQVVTYGVGNIIGAGIYVLVGAASGLAGGAVWMAFLVGAVIALFTGLSYAELVSMYPRDASEYTYIGRAYGNKALSFLGQWMMLITEMVAAAAVSLGFAYYFQSILPSSIPLVAAGLLAALTIIAIKGIKQSLTLNTVLSAIAIGGLLIVIAAAVPKFGSVNYTISPTGTAGIFGAAILVFFAYIGFDNIANLAEETKRPQRNLPRGLLIAVAITTVLYVLVGISAVTLAAPQKLAVSDAPLALAASATFGSTAYDVLTLAALLTTLNTVLVMLITSSRIVYGMSNEGVLPKALGRISKRTGTPILASLFTFLVALLFIPIGNVGIVAKITSFGSLVVFIIVNFALLHLRRTAPHFKRPFKVPLNIGWVSVTAVLGAVSCFLLLTQFDLLSIGLGLLLPISGMIVYVFTKGGKILEIDKKLHQQHEKR
ncbi:MAG: amino acid permease [Candidatus Micrarchaeota archaeon]|nr:amino acid permease [Candidatus Micrarchaeota archaeon]